MKEMKRKILRCMSNMSDKVQIICTCTKDLYYTVCQTEYISLIVTIRTVTMGHEMLAAGHKTVVEVV